MAKLLKWKVIQSDSCRSSTAPTTPTLSLLSNRQEAAEVATASVRTSQARNSPNPRKTSSSTAPTHSTPSTSAARNSPSMTPSVCQWAASYNRLLHIAMQNIRFCVNKTMLIAAQKNTYWWAKQCFLFVQTLYRLFPFRQESYPSCRFFIWCSQIIKSWW